MVLKGIVVRGCLENNFWQHTLPAHSMIFIFLIMILWLLLMGHNLGNKLTYLLICYSKNIKIIKTPIDINFEIFMQVILEIVVFWVTTLQFFMSIQFQKNLLLPPSSGWTLTKTTWFHNPKGYSLKLLKYVTHKRV